MRFTSDNFARVRIEICRNLNLGAVSLCLRCKDWKKKKRLEEVRTYNKAKYNFLLL